jgi:hypothetical protein
MRVLEECMGAWPMADMQKQIDAMREAFSADVRKPFVLKASFPYGSPQSAKHSTPPRPSPGFQGGTARIGPMDQHIDTNVSRHSQVSYASHPISPPISAGPADMKSDSSPAAQSLVMMTTGPGSQAPAMSGPIPLAEAPAWNPSRIFE